jgi:hypothetical protein
MRHSSRLFVAALTLAATLGTAGAAHAGVSVGVDIGLPLVGAYGYPMGGVGVHYGNGWGWRHRGYGYGGVGVVVGAPLLWPSVVYEQPVVVVPARPATPPAPAVSPPPSRSDPVVYPRNGQSAQQIEADRQACDRWATTQPAALADGAVFIRAVEACMDGRGYTLK